MLLRRTGLTDENHSIAVIMVATLSARSLYFSFSFCSDLYKAELILPEDGRSAARRNKKRDGRWGIPPTNYGFK